ncbi:hypothetical protein [Enterococcus sp. 5B3_DIV0040]|uniref:hypothetical protein n=1 Tax=Enterococcus sp. 5B3_DIV0040 TaxID=1834182 RepID=UPI000A3565C3|nr:hypothetical protein [Enterococcus sp. 5B3_DIV0040]OTO01259.1 hypothetical protein A5883_003576 [Enterococcus sp. 5B3_DIV0040]
MAKKEPQIECYILGQRNEHGMIEWLIDDLVYDWRELDHYLSQAGYLCDYVDGECWKYRLKISNQIDFYIRKILIPQERKNKKTTT